VATVPGPALGPDEVAAFSAAKMEQLHAAILGLKASPPYLTFY
jgi:hypothetical protein